ncbi:DUF6382 domain-containing protein [Paenibacillus allorhizosphaerae]|uniref:FHA domain-containing protein n=1 Tax=Paenibacillus allorhizosphaerae TaxID=2849866 RepID=A0ABM8VE49_9BACL|nr:DUF6382 domain-containing protein [Paenibacillus allorhizosphaerae]CAG7630000.1 hypothetical protein PAECIP111802_01609 [Paenibacillus allorhizosphaerae]
MAQPIYDLTVDYVNHHGHFMVLSSIRGLTQEELSDFQLHMMAANRIPHLLELQLEAREGNIQLYYQITGKRMLAHFLRMEKLTMHQYFSLLHRIVEVLCDSKVYMLLPGRYILKEDFIYCGNGLEDVYLTYVPKEHLEGKEPLASDLQQLASKWIHRVTELNGNGYQELMNCLYEDNFNLPELKQLLLKHMRHTATVLSQTAAHPSYPNHSEELHEWSTHGIEQAATVPEKRLVDRRIVTPERSAVADLLRIETGFSSSDTPGASMVSETLPNMIDSTVKESRRKHLLIVLMAVLILCFIWKLYAESMERYMLYGCAGASSIVGVAAVLLLRNIRLKRPNELSDEPEFGVHEQGDSRFFNEIGLSDSAPDPAPLSRVEPVMDMNTTLLQRADATVFLGRSADPSMGVASMPYLEYRKKGVCEKVLLDKNSFVIGRAGEGADWVQEEVGVSRLHAEIVKEEAGYGIKDLGSRNGTTLNGEILVPYRVHPLKEGDIVKIVTTELIFKMGL